MKWVCLAGLLLVGCSEEVAGLGTVDGADNGVDTGPRDSGPEDPGPADVGGPEDLGSLDIGPEDLGLLDIGLEAPPCSTAWVTVADHAARMDPMSVAHLGTQIALTYDGYDDAWDKAGYLLVFDLQGAVVAGPVPIEAGARVVSWEGRFLLGGLSGVRWLDSDGLPEAAFDDRPFVPHAVIGDRVYGVAPAEDGLVHPAQIVGGSLRLLHDAVRLDPATEGWVFGPERVLVVTSGVEGSLLELYDLRGNPTGPSLSRGFERQMDTSGQAWVPSALGAGHYDPAGDRFVLRLAHRPWGQRLLGVISYAVATANLATELLEPPAFREVGHEQIRADGVGFGDSLAWSLVDRFEEVNAQLHVRYGGTEHRSDLLGPVGSSTSQPRMSALGETELAVVAPFYGETPSLRYRCFAR